MALLFKCPRCRRMHTVPNKTDLKDFECPADVFVQANKPKQQNIKQKFCGLANADGTIRPQWWTMRLATLRDAHLDVPVVDVKVLPINGRHTGKTRSAYKY